MFQILSRSIFLKSYLKKNIYLILYADKEYNYYSFSLSNIIETSKKNTIGSIFFMLIVLTNLFFVLYLLTKISYSVTVKINFSPDKNLKALSSRVNVHCATVARDLPDRGTKTPSLRSIQHFQLPAARAPPRRRRVVSFVEEPKRHLLWLFLPKRVFSLETRLCQSHVPINDQYTPACHVYPLHAVRTVYRCGVCWHLHSRSCTVGWSSFHFFFG
jgi:hypothetical protein